MRAFRAALRPDVCTCSPAITADILQPAGPAGIASDSQLRRVTRAGEGCQPPRIDLPGGLAEKAPLRRRTAQGATMHVLFLHNSLTRRKERFEPLDPQHVRMYVCGATVYDLVHVGNARPEVVYDVLARLLRRLYPRLTYVRNITDVEDKINARAHELGEPISTLTARTIADYHADLAALGSFPPDVEPRATEHIADMIAMIEKLIAFGPCLCGGRPRAVRGEDLSGLRPSVGPQSGRIAGRRAGGCRAVQARPGGLRAVEAVHARSARAGSRPGAAAGRAGTSSAARCRGAISARRSTSMAAAPT